MEENAGLIMLKKNGEVVYVDLGEIESILEGENNGEQKNCDIL